MRSKHLLSLGLVTLCSVACSKDGTGASSNQAAAGIAAAVSDAGTTPPNAAANSVTTPAAGRASTPTSAATSGSPSVPTGGATPQAGGPAAASSGAPAAQPTGCSRELLQATTDSFYTALAAHDPTMLPRADNLKLTENGMTIEPGEGLWQTAGAVKYKHTALDTEACSTVSESVVPDGSMDIPVGLRLKLVDQKLSEVEMIAVRPGDYKVFGSSFPSNTEAIAASKDVVKWEEIVPEDQRNSRAEIQDWLDKYFRLFPRYGCNLADDCQRLENGGGSFECNAALSCDMDAMPSERGALTPRTFVIDIERGIGVGFTMFMGNTDFHMIKMYGGEIHAVHAILGAAESSGWD